MSLFENVLDYPPDPILGLVSAFQADTHPNKVDLSIGVYRREDLAGEVMAVVKEAEAETLRHEKEKSYLPIDGDPVFIAQIAKLLFGEAMSGSLIYGAQTVGGTAALRIGADFLYQEKVGKIAISSPTWANHRPIFTRARLEVNEYCHARVLDTVQKIPEGTIVLFHGSCHNPTGRDFTLDVWKALSTLCKTRRLIPFFDVAYQGFGRGLEEDAAAVRLFARDGHEMLVAYSCAKNFSLYGERVGALFVVAEEEKYIARLRGAIRVLIRTTYSNPPRHGSSIVAKILGDDTLRGQWERELATMRARMHKMRKLLAGHLTQELHRDFSFIEQEQGLFSLLDISEKGVEKLKKDFGIYLPSNGRINVTGINEKNIDYVVDALKQVMMA